MIGGPRMFNDSYDRRLRGGMSRLMSLCAVHIALYSNNLIDPIWWGELPRRDLRLELEPGR